MKIEVENVKGINNKLSLEVKENRLNILKGENSIGKSSFISGLIALNMFSRRGLQYFFQEEAKKLGLLAHNNENTLGFVNIHKDAANVKLVSKEENIRLSMKSNNKYEISKDGDMKFLFTCFLSRESKILRQLNGIDESQPDDFSWIINKLSPVIDIEPIISSLEKKLDWCRNLLMVSKEKEKSIEENKRALEKIKVDLKKLENEQKKLKKYFDSSLIELQKERDVLEKENGRLRKEISQTETGYNQKKRELENDRKTAQKLIKEADKLKEEINTKKKFLEKLYSEKDIKLNEIQRKIDTYKHERSKIDGKLELLQRGSETLEDKKTGGEKIKCPLCENGTIQITLLEKKILELTSQRQVINNEIIALSKEKLNFKKTIENLENEIPRNEMLEKEKREKAEYLLIK